MGVSPALTPSAPSPSATSPASVPLCVDLDGTLVRSDLLFECFTLFLKQHPFQLWKVPFWLLKGRAHLKEQLALHCELDAELLPLNEDLVSLIRTERALGRRVLLVTACIQPLAQQIADRLGLFDEVIASHSGQNLKGAAKQALLVGRFGQGGFDYAGDSRADLPVWRDARRVIVVDGGARLCRLAASLNSEVRVLPRKHSRWRAFLRAMRPYQWVKNVLVFVPVITSHDFQDRSVLANGGILFAAWCAVASGIYLCNDLLDLNADRAHYRKHRRPFASGNLPIVYGLVGAPILIGLGLVLALSISWKVAGLLLAYVIVSQAYSLHLKKRLLVDVFCLAFLYTIRVVGGGEATGHPVTIWLLAFSSFLFLGLAFLKRCSELVRIRELGRKHLGTRGYGVTDLSMLEKFGTASSFTSVVVLSLYINSNVAELAYATPIALWTVVPLLLLWQCRLWMATSRGEMHDDPIVFSLKDPVSWGIGACMGLAFLASLLIGQPA